MGYKHIDTLHEVKEESSLQERVGFKVPEGNYDSSDDSPSIVKEKKSVTYADVCRRSCLRQGRYAFSRPVKSMKARK